MEERGCMSCHHVPFLLWTHRAALAKGFDVDSDALTDWEAWSIKDSLEQRNLYRLQNYELGKIDDATLPATVKEKLKPLIETPFKMLDDFRQNISDTTDPERLKARDEIYHYWGTPGPLSHCWNHLQRHPVYREPASSAAWG